MSARVEWDELDRKLAAARVVARIRRDVEARIAARARRRRPGLRGFLRRAGRGAAFWLVGSFVWLLRLLAGDFDPRRAR